MDGFIYAIFEDDVFLGCITDTKKAKRLEAAGYGVQLDWLNGLDVNELIEDKEDG